MSSKNEMKAKFKEYNFNIVLIILYVGIFIMSIAVMSYSMWLGITLTLVTITLGLYNMYVNIKQEEKSIDKLKVENLIDRAIVENIPLPFFIIDKNGNIMWGNREFEHIIKTKESYFNKNIEEIIPAVDEKKMPLESGIFNILFRENFYDVTYKRTLNKENNITTILYMVDRTELKYKLRELENKRTCIGLIYINNYEEITSIGNTMEESNYMSEIDKKIYMYGNKISALVEKLDNDKYIFIFEKKHINYLRNKKFDILDDIKEIKLKNKMPVTLSVAIGISKESVKETYVFARSAMDLALGRGGDQAVIKTQEGFEFFGGRSKSYEKRTKVKARIVADAIKELVNEADNIIIMGHKLPDFDCFGSSMGMRRAIRSLGKEAKIVLNKGANSIEPIYNLFKEKYPESMGDILNTKEAKKHIGENTLCIVVDTHKPSQVASREALEQCKSVIVIDHHRRGLEFIENTALSYIETYASSTSELVTEILSYISEKVDMKKVEAEALLAGIILDTKNFSLKTGVRTFEAASLLRRQGAETDIVRKLFRGNLNELQLIAEVISNAEIINNDIIVSKLEKNVENSVLISAKSADELLNTEKIRATFIICKSEDLTHISARSVENTNIQAIMEEMGGGGHVNSAGTQIKNSSIEEVEGKLKEIINKYIEKGEI